MNTDEYQWQSQGEEKTAPPKCWAVAKSSCPKIFVYLREKTFTFVKFRGKIETLSNKISSGRNLTNKIV